MASDRGKVNPTMGRAGLKSAKGIPVFAFYVAIQDCGDHATRILNSFIPKNCGNWLPWQELTDLVVG